MANKTRSETLIPKLPSMNFGKKPMGFASVQKVSGHKSYIPTPVRVTQNKGGGGK